MGSVFSVKPSLKTSSQRHPHASDRHAEKVKGWGTCPGWRFWSRSGSVGEGNPWVCHLASPLGFKRNQEETNQLWAFHVLRATRIGIEPSKRQAFLLYPGKSTLPQKRQAHVLLESLQIYLVFQPTMSSTSLDGGRKQMHTTCPMAVFVGGLKAKQSAESNPMVSCSLQFSALKPRHASGLLHVCLRNNGGGPAQNQKPCANKR